jgi:hypothetical protein
VPVRIDRKIDEKNEEVVWLCDDEWELPTQLETLEKWLKEKGQKLSKGTYVADVGYSPRPNACGGGGMISTVSMQIMVSIGMELFLSEYPEMIEEESTNE